MKRLITFCLCVTLCFVFASCKNDSDVNVPMGLQLASNENVPDYVLMVPDDWEVDDSTGTTTAYYKDKISGAIISTFTASFSVPESNDITIDNYFESYSEEFNQVFGETTEVDASSTTLDGNDARQYIYSAKFGDIDYTFWQVICMHDGRIYTLTYSTVSEYFEKFSEDMDVILEYFSFK